MQRHLVSSALLALLVIQGTYGLSKCLKTYHCADSGTICKVNGRPVLDVSSDQPQSDYFAPITEEDLGEPQEVPVDDFDQAADLDAEIASAQSDDASVLNLKPGTQVTPVNLDDADAAPGSPAIRIGTILKINGWKCQVTAIKATPNKDAPAADAAEGDAPTQVAEAEADALEDPAADAAAPAANWNQKLQQGKMLNVGRLTCRLIGPVDSNKATATPKPGTATVKPVVATGGAVPPGVPKPITTKPVTATVKPTVKPGAPAPATTGNVGQCTCDAELRFPCTTNQDCATRFGTLANQVVCIKSFACPQTALGTTGYCRKFTPPGAFNDPVSA